MIGTILGRLFFGAGRFTEPRKYNIHFQQKQDVNIDRVSSINILSKVTNIVTSRDNHLSVSERQSIKLPKNIEMRAEEGQSLNIKCKNDIIATTKQSIAIDNQSLELSNRNDTVEVKE